MIYLTKRLKGDLSMREPPEDELRHARSDDAIYQATIEL